MKSLAARLSVLESQAYAGMTSTIDEAGNPAWIDRASAITLLREVLRAERDLGRPARLQDLSIDDQHFALLWSRAEPGEGALYGMVIEACRELTHEVVS